MKRFILSAALLALAAGCGTNHEQNQQAPVDQTSQAPTTQPADAFPATQPSASAAPINKYCAVDRDQEVDPKVTYLYQGKVIGFCCDDCIPKFKKDPEKYMKDLK
jgi:YHS domain-containing protein